MRSLLGSDAGCGPVDAHQVSE